MKGMFWTMGAGVLLWAASVSGQEFKLASAEVEFDESVDFSGLEVFRWKESQDPGTDNPAAHASMIFQIERGLQDKGLRKAESADDADFLVRYYTKVERHVRGTGSSRKTDEPRNARTAFDFEKIAEGTLVIELYVAEGERRVWRGWTTESTARKQFSDDQVREAVARILKSYPPRANTQ
jgi:hypothetical protein